MFIDREDEIFCYTDDGILRTYKKGDLWTVERSFENEDFDHKGYRIDKKWHLIIATDLLEAAEAEVQKIIAPQTFDPRDGLQRPPSEIGKVVDIQPDEHSALNAKILEQHRMRARLDQNGYVLLTRAEFDNTPVIASLRKRANPLAGEFVVYDPSDDEDGWLLVGDDADELMRATILERCEDNPDPVVDVQVAPPAPLPEKQRVSPEGKPYTPFTPRKPSPRKPTNANVTLTDIKPKNLGEAMERAKKFLDDFCRSSGVGTVKKIQIKVRF